ncbi:SNARE protein, putative [Plasmodium chabaudi chabaudi]|uniref:SNARE protein, putative n=3 Tax=Plasmodium (Vinckeia) TaxID=418101 RepID=A0A077YEP2_PLACU|nr:SNARE protein, putative [Plasmodium chabaudi chabaudi]CAD2093287.1 SNARE protein, putative [Plasmodium vinckei brucechwatti]SCM07077.1 SNARE protein, putative [Plasmodium chabaudi adami]SCM02128.1 SNARE protein, putative [Plasmodium chabaudi chabaudi]SCM04156.1 SNARE protein, putative [Plasmodium chabaudi chabaudi]SCM10464.1 SNARE protein, putative [Plasmodium chabaudi adami]|eukprot:XP_742573.2 SNARE protein, putative [Plasmodium chabaudi chabaudi]
MEDILGEIISLSEKKKDEMNRRNDRKGTEYDGKSVSDESKSKKGNDDYYKKKRRGSSVKDDDTINICDASTVCTVDDDINIEKVNIFSKIIKNNKSRTSEHDFKDVEKNIDENTPLFFNNGNTLNTYLLTVNEINTNISNIYTNIDKINVIKKKIELNIYDNEKLYAKINVIIKNSEDIITSIKEKINKLNAENSAFEENSNMISEIKLRVNIFIDIVNKYKNCINKYKNICNQYYEHVNKNIIKHYKLIHPNLSDHSIHKLLKQNNHNMEEFLNVNKSSYKNNVMCFTNIDQLEIDKIKEKYNELKNLEKNIAGLNELYIELAYVIKKRKNLINNIESNVFQVKEYTEDALHNIVEAKRYNQMIKQKILYFSLFLLIIAFIILFPVFFNYSHF